MIPTSPKSGETGPIQGSPLSTFSSSQDLCSVPPGAKDLYSIQPSISHNFYCLQLDSTAEKLLIKGSVPAVNFHPESPRIHHILLSFHSVQLFYSDYLSR